MFQASGLGESTNTSACLDLIQKTMKIKIINLPYKLFYLANSSIFSYFEPNRWGDSDVTDQGRIWLNYINEPHYPDIVRLCNCNVSYYLSTFTIHSSVLGKKIANTRHFFLSFSPILMRGKNIIYLLTNLSVSFVWTNVYWSNFHPNATSIIKVTMSSLIPSGISLVRLVVGHNILPKERQQDERK